MPKYAVILLAAGGSSRFKDRDKKQFCDLDGRAAWLRSLELFTVREDVTQIVIVIAAEDREMFERRYRANVAFCTNAKVIEGGAERADSVQNALAVCAADVDFIAIHDTARPCLTREMIAKVFDKAAETDAAVLAHPICDTIKRVADDGTVAETIPRDGLWVVQTPQVFRRPLILNAYAHRDKAAGPVTDDAMLVEALGEKVSLVQSDATNIKITAKQDLILAKGILQSRPKPKAKAGLHPFADEDMWK